MEEPTKGPAGLGGCAVVALVGLLIVVALIVASAVGQDDDEPDDDFKNYDPHDEFTEGCVEDLVFNEGREFDAAVDSCTP